jgi:hypothetical protein
MTDPTPGVGRFLLAGEPGLLRPLLDILAADPEVAVISVGTRPEPDRLVVAMDSARAQALSVAFGNRLAVEPDQDLTLLTPREPEL